MNRTLLVTLLALSGTTGALTVSGTAGTDGLNRPRVGAWLVSSTGTPLGELASAAITNGTFALHLPTQAPTGRALWPLTSDHVTWPGVTGHVAVTPNVLASETRLFAYDDTNANGRRDEAERLVDVTVTNGKASVILVYVDRAADVSAPRGFNARLSAGWNVLRVELGKTLKVSVATSVADVQLSLGK